MIGPDHVPGTIVFFYEEFSLSNSIVAPNI